MLSKKESKLCKVERAQEQKHCESGWGTCHGSDRQLTGKCGSICTKKYCLQIKKKDGFLVISVEDDGIGFVDTEEKVTEPFYHKNPQDDLKHFGLGMYISRIFLWKAWRKFENI